MTHTRRSESAYSMLKIYVPGVGNIVSCNYIQIIWNFKYSVHHYGFMTYIYTWNLLWLISMEFMLAGTCT
jgi:hypothetical protein